MSKHNVKAESGKRILLLPYFFSSQTAGGGCRVPQMMWDRRLPVWDLCNLISALKKRPKKNKIKRQTKSSPACQRNTAVFTNRCVTARTLAGCGTEQMDDKSVSNEGKLTARCQCQRFTGGGANLFVSASTGDGQSAGKQRNKKWMISLRCKCSGEKLLVFSGSHQSST